MSLIGKFIGSIREFKAANVFNPYSDCCPTHDHERSADIRSENLEILLKAAIRQKVKTIWFGRDLGYLGGRRTGLALTDEASLMLHQNMFEGVQFSKATTGVTIAEKTAKIIWEQLSNLDEPVFLWNIFPFHPHEYLKQMSNRCHTKKERLAAEPFIKDLIELLGADQFVAIGNDAHTGLTDMGLSSIKVRHPSYGGKSDFISGITEIHKISPKQRVLTFH